MNNKLTIISMETVEIIGKQMKIVITKGNIQSTRELMKEKIKLKR